MFSTFKALETAEVSKTFNKAASGADGFIQQYHALVDILNQI